MDVTLSLPKYCNLNALSFVYVPSERLLSANLTFSSSAPSNSDASGFVSVPLQSSSWPREPQCMSAFASPQRPQTHCGCVGQSNAKQAHSSAVLPADKPEWPPQQWHLGT